MVELRSGQAVAASSNTTPAPTSISNNLSLELSCHHDSPARYNAQPSAIDSHSPICP